MIGNFLLHVLAISQTSIHVESFSATQPCNYRTKSVLLLKSLSNNTIKRKKQTTAMTMSKPQPYIAEALSLTEMSTVSRMQRKLEELYLQSSKIRCPVSLFHISIVFFHDCPEVFTYSSLAKLFNPIFNCILVLPSSRR